jgi:hypothetical protein
LITPEDLYINSCSKIGGGRAWIGEEIFFQQADLTAAGFLPALYKQLAENYPKFYKMDRLSQLGILGAALLLRGKGFPHHLQPTETAIVLANKHSSLDTDTRFVAQLDDIPSPAVFVYTLPNIVIGEISIRYGIKGEQAFYVMAAPDMVFLQQYVQILFAEGKTKNCLLGWVDIFEDNYLAVIFAISAMKENALGKLFTAENLYQYLHHEQGAVSGIT